MTFQPDCVHCWDSPFNYCCPVCRYSAYLPPPQTPEQTLLWSSRYSRLNFEHFMLYNYHAWTLSSLSSKELMSLHNALAIIIPGNLGEYGVVRPYKVNFSGPPAVCTISDNKLKSEYTVSFIVSCSHSLRLDYYTRQQKYADQTDYQ